MIFGELPLAEAEGAILAHAVMLAGRRVAKGCVVDAALLEAARAAGLERLWVARAGPEDVAEAEAARTLGEALAGEGVEARAPVHGRVNLHARHDGLLLIDRSAIGRANAATEAVGIATLPPLSPVRAGELVATVKIIPFALERQVLGTVLAGLAALAVQPWRTDIAPCLIQTVRDDTQEKAVAKTAAVSRERLARFGWRLTEAGLVPHAVGPLAEALGAWRGTCGLILVAGATATADRRDVVPAAIAAAGGRVERVGMPVDPGNLLVLGSLGDETVVIGLPGCARSPKRNGLDLVLERLAAGLAPDSGQIAEMGVGGLLEDSGVPVPWAWG